MTRALWITGGYPWNGDPVGGGFFRTQANALRKLGLPVTVAVPTPVVPWPLGHVQTRWNRYAAAPREIEDDGILIIRPRYPNVPGQPTWARPDRTVASSVWRARAKWNGATVIHGHYAVTSLAAWRLSQQTGLPFFLTFHGDDMNTWPDSHPDRIADLRAAVSDASGVFAVSHALAERVRDVTGLDATVLPLGSDHDWIASSSLPRDDARQSIGLPEDRIVVLFVGYLTREKGVRELASAILDLGDPFVGVFVGEGPELGFGSDDLRAQGRLVFPGAMAHGDVIRYMSAADVLLLPSYGEGLPTVLVEAGSVGLPVIASAVGGIPELLGQDRGVLLPEVSASAITSALTDFRGRRAEATLDAARLREHVREAYDVNTNARRLLEHYRAADRTGGGT